MLQGLAFSWVPLTAAAPRAVAGVIPPTLAGLTAPWRSAVIEVPLTAALPASDAAAFGRPSVFGISIAGFAAGDGALGF